MEFKRWRFLGITCLSLLSNPLLAQQNPPSPQHIESLSPYLPGPLDAAYMLAPPTANPKQPKSYILAATPGTTQWGYFDSSVSPVLHINSGDTVVIETAVADNNQLVPGVTIRQLLEMTNAVPGRGPHTLTGPIYINDAMPGDVLQIHFNKIVPRAYASNDDLPRVDGKGLFPNEFPNPGLKYFYLDVENKKTIFAPNITVPLAPFPGIVAVARQTPGKFNSSPPGPFGGNLDLREMTEGTTLYLPVFVKGALLWSGDSHAGQGNGEINLTAIETAFKELNITVTVIKQKSLAWPRLETPTAWIAMGYDRNLNKALDLLKSETIKLIMEKRQVNAQDAEKMMYENWNCPIAEVVNGVQGTYCIFPKSTSAAKPNALPKEDNDALFVTYAKNADIEKAMKIASMAMINKIAEQKHLSRRDTYVLLSLSMDCRMGPYKSGDKEVHCMVAKNMWTS
jgi:acetamidase/formamidase